LKEKDQIILILYIGTILIILLAVFLVVFVIAYKRRQLNHLLEKLDLKHEFDNQLLQSRLETQERSFQYFSEEIHDNVGQVLSVVGMHLYQLKGEYAGERAAKLVEQSSDMLNKAINDLRTISHTLNAQYISKAGLHEALKTEIEYINSVKQVHCRLDLSGEPAELSGDRETLLFRIIQEAIGNALKHAKASEIIIRLVYEAGQLRASISDNGIGFIPGNISAPVKNGLGITNMELRARLLGGNLEISSRPQQGTTISLTLKTNIDQPNP
jgi:signal transduction histidine kinase